MARFKSIVRFKLEPTADREAFIAKVKTLANEGKEKLGEHGLADAILWQPLEPKETIPDLELEFVWQSLEQRNKLRDQRGEGGGEGMQKIFALIQDPAIAELTWGQYVENA